MLRKRSGAPTLATPLFLWLRWAATDLDARMPLHRVLHHLHYRQRFAVPQRNGEALHLHVALQSIQGHAGQRRSHLKSAKPGLPRGLFHRRQNQRSQPAPCEVRVHEDGPHFSRIRRRIEQFRSAPRPAIGADEAAIRAAIKAQVEAWNQADISGFMRGYEESEETTFIGANIGKGYGKILERYQKNYSTSEQMGKLTFNDLEIRILPSACGHAEFAVATGRFHLERTQKGEAKKDDGIFSLVWRKGRNGWKILLDHTS